MNFSICYIPRKIFKQGEFVMEWNDLERFTLKGARRDYPCIMITKNNYVIFNKGFIRKYEDLCNRKYLVIYYSKNKNAVVFDFTNNENEEGKREVIKKNNRISTYSLRSFFNHNKIDKKAIYGKYLAGLENIPNFGEKIVIYIGDKFI